MNRPRQVSSSSLPSFSIVLETENLAQADLAGLFRSLASLEAQSPSPAQANEVLLIDSGDTPLEILAQLCDRYPWLQVYRVPAGIEYYGAKMLGAQASSGEVVVFYDSDCVYGPDWLSSILASFQALVPGADGADTSRDRTDRDRTENRVEIVAGETRTQGVGVYATAMAIAYIFPQYSGQTGLQPSSQYFLNNVAFRRSVLLAHPIPTHLPLYRGNCVVHAQSLMEAGHTIWRQPQAQASHAAPNGVKHFFWRFLLIGYDYYWQKQLLGKRRSPLPVRNQEGSSPMGGVGEKLVIFRDRLRKLMAADWRHGIFFPLAIPIMLGAALLIYAGYVITAQRQNYLLDLRDRWAVEI